MRASQKRARPLIGALIGATYALLIPLVRLPSLYQTGVKLAVGGLMSKCGVKTYGKKRFALSFFLLFSYTFLFGGTVTGLYALQGRGVAELSNLQGIPLYLLLGAGFFCFRLGRDALSFVKREKEKAKYEYDLSLSGKERLCVKGFLDTGNCLTDGKGRGVLIVTPRLAKRLKRAETSAFQMPVQTASGSATLQAFTIDRAVIYGERETVLDSPTVAVAREIFPLSDCEVLLNRNIFAENGEKTEVEYDS